MLLEQLQTEEYRVIGGLPLFAQLNTLPIYEYRGVKLANYFDRTDLTFYQFNSRNSRNNHI